MSVWSTRLASIFRENTERVLLVDAIDRTGEITYGAFWRRAAALAFALEAKGITAADRVGIVLPNGVNFATVYFACLLGGFTAVPINNALSAKDRSFILGGSRIKALVLAGDSREWLDPKKDPSLLIVDVGAHSDLVMREATDVDVAGRMDRLDDDRLFSIHFTSGTTSLPKGVPHRVGALLGNADAFNRSFGLGRGNCLVHVMPMSYMAGFLNTLLCTITAEAKIVLAPQFSAQSAIRFWEPISAHQGDTLWVSPTMLATLVRLDRSSVGIEYCRGRSIRIFSATAPLTLSVRQEFEAKYGVEVTESYGLSELLLLTANHGPKGRKDGCVGRAVAGVEIEIRDESGQVQEAGVDGGIFVRTPHAMVGYLNFDNGEPTPPAESWFDTGDVGHLDPDGYLFVTGRQKDLIIRGGFNVSPRQIEEALLRQAGVADAAVVGVQHSYYGEEVVAAVIAHPGYELGGIEAELKAACRRELGPTLVPDRFVAFEAFPRSTMGKVQKNKIREHIAAGTGA